MARWNQNMALLQWPRIAYLVIGALMGAIVMELMRRSGW